MREELIKKLREKNVVKYGDFMLKSGRVSNIYVDLRKVYGNPEIMKLICSCLAKTIVDMSEKPNVVAASGDGGIPLATIISQMLGLKLTLGIFSSSIFRKILTINVLIFTGAIY